MKIHKLYIHNCKTDELTYVAAFPTLKMLDEYIKDFPLLSNNFHYLHMEMTKPPKMKYNCAGSKEIYEGRNRK